MKIKNKKQWEKIKADLSQTIYGDGISSYAEKWANEMEVQIKQGKTVAECAKETSNTSNSEAITGYMYDCAVASLCIAWKYGEELRQWHNNNI